MTQKKKIIIIASVVVVALFVAAVLPFILPWSYRDADPRKGAETPDFTLSSFSLTYGITDGYMSVENPTFLTGSNVKVADLYFGLPVTSIGDEAFKDNTKLQEIILPGGLMIIGSDAFSGCTSITDIIIPTGVTSIERNAFKGCTGITNIVLPGNVEIGSNAFNGCTSLTSLTILDGKTAISSNAFKGCASLTEVSVPNDIKSIDANAFSGCDNIVFSKYDNALYLGNAENPYVALITTVDKDITSCDIHPDTKIIADEAFADCFLLESIYYGDTVENWNKISFPFSWDINTGDYTVYCTDGEI